jgi:hypothetical protein
LADFNICWINFIIEKICLETILDAVNEEKKESKRITLLKMLRKKC